MQTHTADLKVVGPISNTSGGMVAMFGPRYWPLCIKSAGQQDNDTNLLRTQGTLRATK